jgi:hypothetical protein
MNGLALLLRPALLVAVLALVMGGVVQAAGSATIRDDAGLFTAAGRSAIERNCATRSPFHSPLPSTVTSAPAARV